jgi:hypothetical protein
MSVSGSMALGDGSEFPGGNESYEVDESGGEGRREGSRRREEEMNPRRMV